MSEAGLQSVVIQFGLDMVVFLDITPVNAMRLFEVKAYGEQRRGGIGFGNGEGIRKWISFSAAILTCDCLTLRSGGCSPIARKKQYHRFSPRAPGSM